MGSSDQGKIEKRNKKQLRAKLPAEHEVEQEPATGGAAASYNRVTRASNIELRPEDILKLQQATGNRAVRGLIEVFQGDKQAAASPCQSRQEIAAVATSDHPEIQRQARPSDPITRRGPGSRYLLKEGRETQKEIRASRRSPGGVMAVHKNAMGGTWAWIVYDFAVNQDKLKSGQKSGLSQIVGQIKSYANLYGGRADIIVSGHASPSGAHGKNLDLAFRRISQVSNWLVTNGNLKAESLGNATTSEVYSVVKGVPTSPWQRAIMRSVYIVLPHKRSVKPPPRFDKERRRRIRDKIGDKATGRKKKFFYWVLDNWDYLIKTNYCWERTPRQDGLFFKRPERQLRTDAEAWPYLNDLYNRFLNSLNRLSGKYVGPPGIFVRREPTRAYQQLARWAALDHYAQNGSVQVFRDLTGQWVPATMKQLIIAVYNKKYGDYEKVRFRTEKYLTGHSIPIRFPDKGTAFIIANLF